MTQTNNSGAIAITVALIGLLGVIGAALINKKEDERSSDLTTVCKVTRPYGLYLFDQPNQYSAVLLTLPQNSKVELNSLDFTGRFAKVTSSSGSGWVVYQHLNCS